MKHDELTVSRAEFEQNLADKLDDAEFLADISPLLAPEYQWEPEPEAEAVSKKLIELVPGEPWKGRKDD